VQPLALTLGEPAGIGPDITLEAWQRRNELRVPAFYVIGDVAFLAGRAQRLGLPVPLAAVEPGNAREVFAAALPVVSLALEVSAQAGRPDGSSAPAAIASIHRAVRDAMNGSAAGIVTNPVAKSVLYDTGFPEPGHTEYLGKLVRQITGKPAMPVMMLWSPELAVVPVTIHLPLRQVPDHLSIELIVDTARVVARDLELRFGIGRPRLAIAGLNPHAGESGALGAEDREIVLPAVKQLRAEHVDARGPLPADSMFHAAARTSYDAALCMYHDQALIPIKTLAFHHAVNVTLGLPFVRTSPDHGTAFDIAGSGRADPSSLVEALRLAARLTAAVPTDTP
jgi:4-hydroxythreonine-4-phosphate dehydrogenase